MGRVDSGQAKADWARYHHGGKGRRMMAGYGQAWKKDNGKATWTRRSTIHGRAEREAMQGGRGMEGLLGRIRKGSEG